MPKYVIINDSDSTVALPSPLSGVVRPHTNLTIHTEAVNVDTPGMRDILNKRLLRMVKTVDTPFISDHIQIPVVDMIGSGATGLVFQGPWSSGLGYNVNDVVQFGGTSWVALQPSLSVTPVEGLVWTALVTPSAVDTAWNRIGTNLIGTADPRVFSTPDVFVHVVGGLTIEVFDSGGRRLAQAPSSDPRAGDYYVAESGGTGTGFDQVRMLTFTPRGLRANYRTA